MRKYLAFTVTALTVAACAAALLAGCSGSSRGIDLTPTSAPAQHVRAASHRRARVHLTSLGCMYLRESLGLPLLGSPPPPAPGVTGAPPVPQPSPHAAEMAAWVTAHTDCPHPQAGRPVKLGPRLSSSPPHPPTHTSLRTGPGWPPVSAYYPQAAQRLGVEGTASVRVCVNPSGRVSSASIAQSSGSPLLDRAALRYARATSGHWVPAERGGRAAAGCTTLPVRFSVLGGL